MDELPDYAELTIFPNPAQNELTIDLIAKVGGNAQVQIMDLSGRILIEDDMNASSSFAEYFADPIGVKEDDGLDVIELLVRDGGPAEGQPTFWKLVQISGDVVDQKEENGGRGGCSASD